MQVITQDRTLTLLHGYGETRWKRRDCLRWINLDHISGSWWNEWRLQRCLVKSKQDKKADPICVTRYIVNGEAYYSISDGLHRTEARRRLGKHTILAHISCDVFPDPHRFVTSKPYNKIELLYIYDPCAEVLKINKAEQRPLPYYNLCPLRLVDYITNEEAQELLSLFGIGDTAKLPIPDKYNYPAVF